jgi:hypothetical protein
MKSKFLFFALLISLAFSFLFILQVQAKECPPPPDAPAFYIIHCGYDSSCPCEIGDFFSTLVYIYNFIVIYIATPLAVIALIIGGVLLMISAGNPNLATKGKQILWAAIIGLVLVFGSYLIIDFILCTALGYCSWKIL